MRTTRIGLLSLLVLVALGSGCGGADESASRKPASTAGDERALAPTALDAARIGVQTDPRFGAYLVDGSGHPLYAFSADTQGQSSVCIEACARAWPPLLTAGTPQALDPEVQPSRFGTVARREGDRHVTYDGWPLYLYAADLPGQVRGQGVASFGGEWLLMGPDGQRIPVAQRRARASRSRDTR